MFAYLLLHILFCLHSCFLDVLPIFPLDFELPDWMNSNMCFSITYQKPSQSLCSINNYWWDKYFWDFLSGKTRRAKPSPLYILFMIALFTKRAKHKLWCLPFQKELPLSEQSFPWRGPWKLCYFSHHFSNQILWGTPICEADFSRDFVAEQEREALSSMSHP